MEPTREETAEEPAAEEASAEESAPSVSTPNASAADFIVDFDLGFLLPDCVPKHEPQASGSLKNLRKRRKFIGKALATNKPFHCTKATWDMKKQAAFDVTRVFKQMTAKPSNVRMSDIMEMLRGQGNPLQAWQTIGFQLRSEKMKNSSRYELARMRAARSSRPIQYGKLESRSDEQAFRNRWMMDFADLAWQATPKVDPPVDSSAVSDADMFDLVCFTTDSEGNDPEDGDSEDSDSEAEESDADSDSGHLDPPAAHEEDQDEDPAEDE
ncbi:hypothetical protein PRZ48_005994 [Zasmidium cellare]|uniref:Uncharacterized protein n=1 Tax=Zasmidium cellare TaxID=395010 RepID=A0ABR0EP29_ZASCE|nr:hypothetical protein PRZ48_005994 [Zasmidium cellare]